MQPLYDALRDMIPHEKLSLTWRKESFKLHHSVYAGPHFGQCLCDFGWSPKHDPRPNEDVPDAYGQERQIYDYWRSGQIDFASQNNFWIEGSSHLKDVDGVRMIYLDDKDVIHRLVKKIISAYNSIENHNWCVPNKYKLSVSRSKACLQGKVREVYTLENDLLIMIATDRLSAFDVVMPKESFKGKFLNQIATKMMQDTQDLVPNWLIATPDPNVAMAWPVNPSR